MILNSLKFFRHACRSSTVKRTNFSSSKTDELKNDAIVISDNCVSKLKQLCDDNLFLRLCVESGGCSGFQYKFNLDNSLGDDDKWAHNGPHAGLSAEGRARGKKKEEVLGGNTVNKLDCLVFERDGVKVVVDETSLEYIKGSMIDYHTELIRSAFRVIQNPNADLGCSCGASFSIKID